MDIVTIDKDDDRYPKMIRDVSGMPDTLYCRGDVTLFNTPSIAVIGTRNASALALKIAHSIASYFAERGFTIVSGLALGCDTAVHRGALSVRGKTIAVLGTPVDHVYPPQNKGLAERIVANGGLLVSAYADEARDGTRFIARDYLQSALSLAVVPVQAGKNSGTQHACNAAIKQHRLLMVPVPVPEDEAKYPEKYAYIDELLKRSDIISFDKKEDYPALILLLRGIC